MTKTELIKLARKLNKDSSHETIVQLMDCLIEVTQAERGFFLKEGQRDPYVARNIDGNDVQSAREMISDSILKKALEENRPVVVSDAQESQFRIHESVKKQSLRSVVVFALRGIGLFYLDSRSKANVFDDETIALIKELSEFGIESIKRAEKAERKEREVENLRQRIDETETFEGMVGESRAMKELYKLIIKAAAVNYPVLIWGETGTGKELVSRAIHAKSIRANKTLIEVNCGAVSDTLLGSELFGHVKGAFTGADRDVPGYFEVADKSTLFLDEIETMSERLQESLLRTVETGTVRRVGQDKTVQVDVRLICATNENPDILVKDKLMREDLYYRLNVVNIHIPPLRDRKDDIPLLIDFFLKKISKDTGLSKSVSKDCSSFLTSYSWPGNIRQLENSLKRAATLAESETLTQKDFTFLQPSQKERDLMTVDEYIKQAIITYSDRMDVQKLSQRLGISRKTLWEKKKTIIK